MDSKGEEFFQKSPQLSMSLSLWEPGSMKWSSSQAFAWLRCQGRSSCCRGSTFYTDHAIIKRLRREADQAGSHLSRDSEVGYKCVLQWDDTPLKGYEMGPIRGSDDVEEKLFLSSSKHR